MVKESLTVKSNLSMNSKVKVEANKAGQLISVSPNNPQWGWIRVTQNRNVLDIESDQKSNTQSLTSFSRYSSSSSLTLIDNQGN